MSLSEKVKAILKYILPPPVHTFNREVTRIMDAMEQEHRETETLRQMLKLQAADLEVLTQQLDGERLRRLEWEDQARCTIDEQERALALLAQSLETSSTELQILVQRLAEGLDASGRQLVSLAEARNKAEGHLEQLEMGQKALSQALADAGIGLKQQMELQVQSGKLQLDELDKQIKSLSNLSDVVRRQAADSARHASEAVWAQIFNNTISGSMWLRDTAFSPGRWAVGYPYLYVMYRVLNETRPKHILELGLGQSTRMIAQYAAAFDNVEHIVVEHDPEWIKFFCNSFKLPQNTKVIMLEREMVSFKEAEAVRVFKGFKERFQGQKFDFISVDAPLGSDMKQYSRIDVLELLPDGLADSFVILLDDAERKGETHTICEIENLLGYYNIAYERGRYSGKKDCVLISTSDLRFLSSL